MASSSALQPQKLTVRHMIVAVAVCLMACGTMGMPNAYGVFYKPMAEGLNVGQGAVTLHMSVSNLCIGLFTPIVSYSLAHGHRIRNVIAVAGALIAASGLVIGLTESTLVMTVAAAIRGIGYAAVSMLIITLYIGNWFEKGRGTLTGIALSGSGIGSAIASPILTACIARFGYQPTYLGYVGFTLLTLLPVALLCPLTPQEIGLLPLGASDQPARTQEGDTSTNEGLGLRFKMLRLTYAALVLFVICIVLITSLSGHMASLAQDYGYSAAIGGLLLSASMVGNVVSKFVLGALADRFGAFRATACSLITTACGLALILLNPGGQAALLAAGFLFGTSFSIGSLGNSLLTRHLYGDAQYADAYASISLVTSLASAIGVTVIGFAYDLTGSYATPVAVGLALAGVAALCLVYLHWRVTTQPWKKRKKA